MGGVDVAAGEEILNRANIPTFPYPDTAARAFNYMWQYSYNLQRSTKRRRCRKTPPIGRPTGELVDEIIGSRAARKAHHPHRVRIQAGAGRLRHSDRADRSSPPMPPRP